ncbi:hypothetical protein ACQUFE_17730, partial [Enterococcus casseliflavus]|uniref:hypothetical protein n=1 Tax=Enterococcus casseliflavus TaxID=37734 RepID=UPI003D0BBA51
DFPATNTADVVVQFNKIPTQSDLNSILIKGGTLKTYLPNSRFALYNLPPASAAVINNSAVVAYASPNRPVKKKLEFAEPTTNANIALQYGF